MRRPAKARTLRPTRQFPPAGRCFGLAASTAPTRLSSSSISVAPTDAAGFGARGAALLREHDSDHAISDFDRAIALEPGTAALFSLRGAAWFDQGDSARAIADFDKAIERDPHDADTFVRRG